MSHLTQEEVNTIETARVSIRAVLRHIKKFRKKKIFHYVDPRVFQPELFRRKKESLMISKACCRVLKDLKEIEKRGERFNEKAVKDISLQLTQAYDELKLI